MSKDSDDSKPPIVRDGMGIYHLGGLDRLCAEVLKSAVRENDRDFPTRELFCDFLDIDTETWFARFDKAIEDGAGNKRLADILQQFLRQQSKDSRPLQSCGNRHSWCLECRPVSVVRSLKSCGNRHAWCLKCRPRPL